MQKKLEANGLIAAEILNTNHALLSNINEGLCKQEKALKEHRAFVLESHSKLHNEIEKVLETQKDKLMAQIHQHQIDSRTMFMAEFERLSTEFGKNRALHEQTQKWLGVK